jgi:hypothetical protein
MLDAAPDSRLSIKLATRVVIDDRIISMHIKMPISPVCVDCVVSRRSQGVLHKDGRKVHAADGRLDCLGLGEVKGVDGGKATSPLAEYSNINSKKRDLMAPSIFEPWCP